jgi:hypothetical protein
MRRAFTCTLAGRLMGAVVAWSMRTVGRASEELSMAKISWLQGGRKLLPAHD